MIYSGGQTFISAFFRMRYRGLFNGSHSSGGDHAGAITTIGRPTVRPTCSVPVSSVNPTSQRTQQSRHLRKTRLPGNAGRKPRNTTTQIVNCRSLRSSPHKNNMRAVAGDKELRGGLKALLPPALPLRHARLRHEDRHHLPISRTPPSASICRAQSTSTAVKNICGSK